MKNKCYVIIMMLSIATMTLFSEDIDYRPSMGIDFHLEDQGNLLFGALIKSTFQSSEINGVHELVIPYAILPIYVIFPIAGDSSIESGISFEWYNWYPQNKNIYRIIPSVNYSYWFDGVNNQSLIIGFGLYESLYYEEEKSFTKTFIQFDIGAHMTDDYNKYFRIGLGLRYNLLKDGFKLNDSNLFALDVVAHRTWAIKKY